MTDLPPPEHMDVWTRNERLYQTLLGMGLYVRPLYVEGDPERIDWLQVSAGLPGQEAGYSSAEGGVISPVQGTEITEVVSAAEGRRMTVIDLPSPVG